MRQGRIVYVNGSYLPEDQAKISVFDRGFLMADAVYEVTSVLDGKLVDFDGHLARLDRSLAELDMPPAPPRAALLEMHRRLVADNALDQGLVYLQITRGNPGDRSFLFPDPGQTPPSVIAFTQSVPNLLAPPLAAKGLSVITLPDIRWGRRDIKTVQLLYPSMGKMAAQKAGADDAWFVEEGFVTEGTANNAYIVKGRKIITRALGPEILHGITRAAVLRFAAEAQYEVEERPFTLAEAQDADEAFSTAASLFVMPVTQIDGQKIGSGAPGPIAQRLRSLYIAEMRARAI